LDFFLAFFQYYIHLKEKIPMDIEFMIQDTFSLIRPTWVLHTSLEEAAKAFEEANAKVNKPQEGDKVVEAEVSSESEDAGDDDDDGGLSDDEVDVDPETQTVRSNENMGNNDDSSSSSSDDSDREDPLEDDEVIYTRPEEVRDPEADAEFDREFAKMMSESLESRKFERKAVFDVPLPIKRSVVANGQQGNTGTDDESNPVDVPPQKPNTMAFSLLMKKGNKQQVRALNHHFDSP